MYPERVLTESLPFPSSWATTRMARQEPGFAVAAGDISKRVLLANVACDAFANRHYLIELTGKKASPPVAARDAAARRIPVLVGIIENADGVHQGVGFARTISKLQPGYVHLALSPPSLTTISTFLSGCPPAIAAAL